MRRVSFFRQRLTIFVIFYVLFLFLLLSFQGELKNGQSKFSPFYYSQKKTVDKQNFYLIVGDNATYIPELPNVTDTVIDRSSISVKKIILFWNTFEFSQHHLGGCPDWNCRIETNKLYANISHAVIFYGSYSNSFPSVRHSWQYYVFFTQESPLHSVPVEPYGNFYNLTLNYRRDADAPCPYGFTVKRPNPLTENSALWRTVVETVSRKRKLAAWFVSNCGAPSGRDKLVWEMQKYMQIDVYGNCGNLKCPQDQHKHCEDMLNENYKFYFAFENSVCRDYVTEKFWGKLSLTVLTVVLKRSVIENYVPPKSFIAVDDFSSPKDLVDYLILLDKETDLYLDYFKWKLNYDAVFLNGNEHDVKERPWGFCRLCQILNDKNVLHKTYPNIQEWWVAQSKCDNKLVDRLISNKFNKSTVSDGIG